MNAEQKLQNIIDALRHLQTALYDGGGAGLERIIVDGATADFIRHIAHEIQTSYGEDRIKDPTFVGTIISIPIHSGRNEKAQQS